MYSIAQKIKDFTKTINPNTLTGAIDVLAIKQEDGTFTSTPFHIKFGKLGVFRPYNTKVFISINGEQLNDLQMILDEEGKAYFIEKKDTKITDDSNEYTINDIIESNPTIGKTVVSQNRVNYFSDGEITPDATSPQGSRPSSPKSDSELDKIMKKNEKTNLEQQQQNEKSSLFGFFKPRKPNKQDGLYLDDAEKLDSEVAALYLDPKGIDSKSNNLKKDEDQDSGSGHSLPQSPLRAYSLLGDVQLSLCGQNDVHDQAYEELFQANLISFDKFCDELQTNGSLNLLNNKNLIIKLNNQYFTGQRALPIILSAIVFNKQLPNNVVQQLQDLNVDKSDKPKVQQNQQESSRWYRLFSSRKENTQISTMTTASRSVEQIQTQTQVISQEQITSKINQPPEAPQPPQPIRMNSKNDHIRLTNRLTSKQIEKLNLRDGINEITYSVTNAIQGTTTIDGYIFLWNYDDKIIVSDIDGTITRSDVGGQVLPMVGFDWTQLGVASLYSAIEKNSYKFIYLSSRAIGQSTITRNYIDRINQDGHSLPDGPLLVSPASLFQAFYKEVIERKPEEFKISCLNDVRSLFPIEHNPFYAGYGNRDTDVKSYKAVGIPESHIFTINPKGELKNEISQTFQTSYSKLVDYVDQIFPPARVNVKTQYTSFNYWKTPLPSIDLEEPTSNDTSKTIASIKKETLTRVLSNPIPFTKYSSSINVNNVEPSDASITSITNPIYIKKSETVNDINLSLPNSFE